MDDYTTRIGRREAAIPAENIYGIPCEEMEDDSLILVSGGNSPVCPDCGTGHLRWAEAGYVPWHRICDVCGSHWDLHPVMYIDWGRADGWTGTGRDGRITPIEELDPDPRLPDGVTHAWLLQVALDAGAVEPNGNSETQKIASACWARRARFYTGGER